MPSDLKFFSISVIIPTLEREVQLERLLNLLAFQKTLGIEVVIVDDSKTRSTIEFEKFNFEVNYFFRGKKFGVSSARNRGASEAKGEYLIFLDDDDSFSSDWLKDFVNSLNKNPDLVFCNMIRTEPDGNRSITECSGEEGKSNTIVIPGAWMIRKSIFEKNGGFDDRLLYAENTEFFIRFNELILKTVYIPKGNFHYFPSPKGGSKNLQNMVDSLLIILDMHQDTLSSHVKYLYHQIIGVNYMRFQNFSGARKHLLKATSYKPYKLGTLARLGISLIPPLAKKLYPKEMKL